MIYLDHLATTPVDLRVAQEMLRVMTRDFGNASSSHAPGRAAAAEVARAKNNLAQLMGCAEREIIFTSGATEAINLLLRGFVAFQQDLRRRKPSPQTDNLPIRILSLPVEHKATLDVLDFLASEGSATVEYLSVDAQGRMDLSELASRLAADGKPDLLVAMAANNEIGNVYPLKAIGELCREYNVLWFCDLSQYAGKLGMEFHTMNIAAGCLSAHKFYGPQGVGAAIVRDDFKFKPLLYGGGQQKGKRPGTLNLPGIVGLGEAARLAGAELSQREKVTNYARDSFVAHLQKLLAERDIPLSMNGDLENQLPGAVHLSLPGVWNAQLLKAIDGELAISSGSACQSGIEQPSHVLRAMKLSEELMRGALRISFGKDSTPEQAIEAAEVLARAAT